MEKLRTAEEIISEFPRITVSTEKAGLVICKLISDVHTELPNFSQAVFELPNDANVLLLAGDIGAINHRRYEEFVLQQAGRFEVVLVVAGNHEYYGSEYYSATQRMREMPAKAEKQNVYFLECNGVFINDLPFIGCALWSEVPPSETQNIAAGLNDYHQIKIARDGVISTQRSAEFPFNPAGSILPTDTNAIHEQHKAWLKTVLPAFTDGCVVLTHHVPTMQFQNRACDESDVKNAFHSDCDDMLTDYGAKLWVFGHTHYSTEGNIGNCLLLSNQLGYMHEHSYAKTLYDPSLAIHMQKQDSGAWTALTVRAAKQSNHEQR